MRTQVENALVPKVESLLMTKMSKNPNDDFSLLKHFDAFWELVDSSQKVRKRKFFILEFITNIHDSIYVIVSKEECCLFFMVSGRFREYLVPAGL